MGGHRKKPKMLNHSDEFLKRTEEYHTYLARVMSGLRVSQPHYNALRDLSIETVKAYCVIAGCEAVPWTQPKPSSLPPQRFD